MKLNTGNSIDQAFSGAASQGDVVRNRFVSIFNGAPGIDLWHIESYGKEYDHALKPSELWQVRINHWERAKHILTLSGKGSPGSAAMVVVTDRKDGVAKSLAVDQLLS